MAVKIIECPRDAMQGIKHPISTEKKVEWMRLLMQCGFDTLDCGSFVNPARVPQMADTHEVLEELLPTKGKNQFLVIVGNERGAGIAAEKKYVDYIGFPFSINDTFQLRNTNAGKSEAFDRLKNIQQIAQANDKKVVAYISMAFGNPYGEFYDRKDVIDWANKIVDLGIQTISLSDTVGTAKIEDIGYVFGNLTKNLPEIEFGAHFHSVPFQWIPKIEAAWNQGCRRYDGAILGLGGCPMADDELTGNIPTEGLIDWINQRESTNIDADKITKAVYIAPSIYG